MAPVTLPGDCTVADLQRRLGGVPAERIRIVPPPGYATADDVARIADQEDRLFELEAGVLVEKAMGWYESLLAGLILTELNLYLKTHRLGKALGADGSLAILPGVVRIPDVSFISWSRWPPHRLPRTPVPQIVPDLVVEVLSESNTAGEMAAKIDRYFEAGVRLMWIVDPASRTAQALTSAESVTALDEQGTLDGGDVLPGFRLSLAALFQDADAQGPQG